MIKQVFAIFFIAVFSGPAVTIAANREETRETMQRIFETLQVVLPLSVDEARFREPILEPNIRQSLRILSKQTTAVSEHGANSDVGFDYLGRSLASYAADASRAYDAHRYESAQVLIQRMTNFCIACHSRVPSPGDSPLAEGFISQSQIANLPIQQRASLQVATRQFDAALQTYEQILADPSIHPADIIGGPLTDYLIVCIRVKEDLSRPIPVLKTFSRRPKVWRSMQEDAGHWIDVLRKLGEEPSQPATLKKGRELIDAALTPETYPMDRQPLVQYIVASSVLNSFIQAKNSRTPEVAEAYYLLGLAEYRIDRDYWVSQAEHYLEAAIRMAPDKPFAQRAYALLEEETILGYTGSSGTDVPANVEKYGSSGNCVLTRLPSEHIASFMQSHYFEFEEFDISKSIGHFMQGFNLVVSAFQWAGR